MSCSRLNDTVNPESNAAVNSLTRISVVRELRFAIVTRGCGPLWLSGKHGLVVERAGRERIAVEFVDQLVCLNNSQEFLCEKQLEMKSGIECGESLEPA